MQLNMLDSADADSSDGDEDYYTTLDRVHKRFINGSSNNILIVPGRSGDEENKLFNNYLNCIDESEERLPAGNTSGDSFGLSCKLCNKIIKDEGYVNVVDGYVYKGERYVLYFEDDMASEAENYPEYGILQCSYCFHYFHRQKCSLSMNELSYIQIRKNRSFACPMCVPEFVPGEQKKSQYNNGKCLNTVNDFITKIFTLLLRSCLFMNIDEVYFLDYVRSRENNEMFEFVDNG